MLLKNSEIEAIRAGRRTVLFRRWRRPSVKAGGTLKTAGGVIAIERLERVSLADISPGEARAAGHDSKDALVRAMQSREGELYRITVRFAGPDPRVGLREDAALEEEERAEVLRRLRRLDLASRAGEWTLPVLGAIRSHPQVPARKVADITGFDVDWLKRNVRKLKDLGLTISHQPGYELSPRGHAILPYLEGGSPGAMHIRSVRRKDLCQPSDHLTHPFS